ncbi:MAG: efflux RND transporter periplasmic adaptor subunit [bacterium]|nr:efflux RND transporter periplasmic adaptor subunit [bacterium]
MKKVLLWVGIILGVVIIILSVRAVWKYQQAKRTIEAAVCLPTRGDIAFEFKVNGSVEPRNQLDINSQVAGRIEQIMVNEGDRVNKGAIIAWVSSTDRATILDAVNSADEKDKAYWEAAYKPTPIVAPLSGFIISRGKEPGQTVSSSDPILVMADRLIIEANVDETDLRHIKLRQQVEIVLDAYPDASYQGTIEHIAYQSEVINNVTVYKVKIQPLKVPEVFRAGMTATVNVVISKKTNALLLPIDAVKGPDGRKMVKVKTGSPKVKLRWSGLMPLANFKIRQVQTGIDDGKNIEILSGLSEGDTVVLAVNGTAASDPAARRNSTTTPGLMGPRGH